jgi:hypothetical protein
MTRRERLERKLALRAEWAVKADARSERASDAAHRAVAGIPLGQPILVGHHSERRHRRDLDRMASNMDKAVAQQKLAAHHRGRAHGLSDQLDRTIFSDDPDAVEQLEAKVVELRAEQERDKALNQWWRKHKTMVGYPGMNDVTAARIDAQIADAYSWEKQPVPRARLSNRLAKIKTAEQRIGEVKARQQRTAAAEDAPNGFTITGGAEYCAVTFAEKPARATLDALKAAGFRWSGGQWCGRREALPACLTEQERPAESADGYESFLGGATETEHLTPS